MNLLTNQYGSFAIQFILTSNTLNNCGDDILYIVQLLGDNIIDYGKNKYSANVLEKCFEDSLPHIKILLVNQIIKEESIVEELLLDDYGNYVIQKCLLVTKGNNYTKILNIIAKNIHKIKKKIFGNKLIAKLVVIHKDLGELITTIQKNGTSVIHTKKS